MSQVVERSGLERREFAEKVGCGTSQIFKYQKEGLPPRMNRLVRANILQLAVQLGVVPPGAAVRENVAKLSKGRKMAKRRAPQ